MITVQRPKFWELARLGITLLLMNGMVAQAQRTSVRSGEKHSNSTQPYVQRLQNSLQRSTKFAQIQHNDEKLWASVRRTITNQLTSEWQSGRLMGSRPEEAFYVKCDRSTMSQNDLDNGRLVVLVGVAPVKPAEFVIIRIGQWTRDRK